MKQIKQISNLSASQEALNSKDITVIVVNVYIVSCDNMRPAVRVQEAG